MKTRIVAMLASSALGARWHLLPDEAKDMYTFQNWKEEFNVTFTSEEDQARSKEFERNRLKILAHNNARPTPLWKMGVNKFAALSESEFRQFYRGRSKLQSMYGAPMADLSAHVAVEVVARRLFDHVCLTVSAY